MLRGLRICEHSLRWILNMHQGLRANPAASSYEHLAAYIERDGHSGGSFNWTLAQARLMDRAGGLDKWLRTPAAAGYDAWLKRQIF